MRALKCNRCTKFYEVKDGGHLAISEIDQMNVSGSVRGLGMTMDFCADCLVSFREWLGEVKKKIEADKIAEFNAS